MYPTHKQENECTDAAIAYIKKHYPNERKESSPTTSHTQNGDVPRIDEQPDTQAYTKELE